ncbi:hypothetical protein BAE44_0018271 [Dichanthelium oligosanthes]|uniref:Uncharacterized protein n=1 Tax=Dichanthelium oligosanthes TaxID=888268 RepID=A0A1E5V6B1_9POAL|nr:hypothetical protein BAE44_0018271 [Dichanthelium oligosanthes]
MAVAILMAVAVAGAVPGVVAVDSTGSPSSLTTWSGPGCAGDTGTVGSCGCTDLQFYGGQEFNFRGETATLYPETGCAGTPYLVFEDTQACGDFGWRSININC